MSLEFQSVVYELVLLYCVVSLVRHSDGPTRAVCHNLESCEHILPKYVVMHVALADQAAQNLTCVNAYLQIDVFERLTAFLAHFRDSFEHAERHENCGIYLANCIVLATFILGDLSIITHDDVHVSV